MTFLNYLNKASLLEKFIGGGLAIVFFLAIAIFLVFNSFENKLQSKIANSPQEIKVIREEILETQNDWTEPVTILLLGTDGGRDKYPGERADSIMLLRIDNKNNSVHLLSIPRDTRVELDGYGAKKINAAQQIGGSKLMIAAVKDLTGLTINHYVQVDFNGFRDIVNSIGGITVDVPQRIHDKSADNTPDKSASLINKGIQTLDGEHALTFARSRAFADGDFTRTSNQRLLIEAIFYKIFSEGNKSNIPSIINTTTNYVGTSMNLSEIFTMANAMKNKKETFTFYSKTFSGYWKSPFVYLDEDAKNKNIQEFIDGIPFDSDIEKKVDENTSTSNQTINPYYY